MKRNVILGFMLCCSIAMTMVGCTGKSGSNNAQDINPADTIYLGDLRDKFKGDTIFFTKVAPDLILDDYQYFWTATESSALEKGLTKEYYKKVKKEIAATNDAIRTGVMKGANMKRVPDFQKLQQNK